MKKILVFCTVAFFLAFSINENYGDANQKYSESLQDISSIAMAGGETGGALYQTMAYCSAWQIKLACTTKKYSSRCSSYYCIVNY
ncbi:hypothetical protein BZG01_10860 [Labilibaculum manganireducens]|uniref:Uncharacterized protein n=1 Tax=Labilibaculum manganireducens TaxID=1940525 RepID=A0A2N3I887_9BACT|nr:hypothetical protein [Labilibaculum manganireducens]PKQ66517.1 hypothetical protein BZG01_10860 [Labilibaculum manganireducens]